MTTTEFIAFARNHDEFQSIETQLIGLSIDSTYSHLAWIRNIKEKFGVEIPFPVIADLSMHVANKYGMVQLGESDTSAVRAVFVIDPDGVLRAMIDYPLTNGRAVAEVLRLVRALQTTDEFKVATPESWQPGEKVVVPPPVTADEADARLTAGFECVDWYFCKRQLQPVDA